MNAKAIAITQKRGAAMRYAPLIALAVATTAAVVVPQIAQAAGGGQGLPWEGPIDTLVKSISGPVAMGISLLGMLACGAGLIWGGEVSEFLKRMMQLVLVISLLVFAKSALSTLFGVGALVPLIATAGTVPLL